MCSKREVQLNIHVQSKQDIVNFAAPIGFLVVWSGGAIFAKVGLQYTDCLELFIFKISNRFVTVTGHIY